MKTKEQFITRDGKPHDSYEAAQSHALANSAVLLRNVIEEACPAVVGAKGIADAIIFKASTSNVFPVVSHLREVMAWLEDSFPPCED